MNNLQDYLIYNLTQEKDIISGDFASFLNHYYGNIKENNVIKQYVFKEGDNKNDVIDFLKEKWNIDLKEMV